MPTAPATPPADPPVHTRPIRPIRFYHRGALVEVADAASGVASTRTVLEWLREDQRSTGTKEGCAEGDCGACTVVLGSLDETGALKLQPVNACIQFLAKLDGQALFTVEDVAAADGTLHPVQHSMVACHGSQCGFCTPGFVMSLWAGYQQHTAAGTVPSRQQLADDLSGNLCRCTGYRPILDAGEQAYARPAVRLDHKPVVAALRSLQADPPLATAGGFHAPQTVEAFAALREAMPQALVLAGSTDIGLWVNKQLRQLPSLIYIGRVRDLARVETRGDVLHIGAAASLEAAWRALVAQWPVLRDLWLRFASLPIRAAGTMGGNVANGSPIGDSAPVLMALGATLVLQRGAVQRRMALEDFYAGYMLNKLEAGEFVHSLEVPVAHTRTVRAYKISKRFDCDISAVCLGAGFQMEGGVLRDARLAFGGLAATVKRASAAEAAMNGQPWTEAVAEAAAAALAVDFKPLSDMRASADYRLLVAQNLVRRLWLETRADDPLPEAMTSVWHRVSDPLSGRAGEGWGKGGMAASDGPHPNPRPPSAGDSLRLPRAGEGARP